MIRQLSEMEKTAIRKLYSEGLPITEICEKVQVSRGAVSKYCEGNRKGKYQNWDSEKASKICLLLSRGKRYMEIAKKWGCTTSAIRTVVCRHRKKVASDPRKKLIISVIVSAIKKGGMSPAEALRATRKADIMRVVAT